MTPSTLRALALSPLLALAAGAALAADAGASAPAAADNPVIAKAAAEPDAVLAPEGYVYRALKVGQGARPGPTDTVKVHYRGTFPDGREFDSSYKRGEPASFPLNRVIRCWTAGVQRMQVGTKARLACPPAMAYGERGAGNVIPPNATLLFEVELLAITSAQ